MTPNQGAPKCDACEILEGVIIKHAKEIVDLHGQRDTALAQCEKLAKALEFYAKLSAIPLQEIIECYEAKGFTTPIFMKYTERARLALAEYRKGGA